jgi:hypothetical protein
MRSIVSAAAAILALLAGVSQACAYTLTLDVKEDRLEIRQAPMKDGSMFGYGDITIEFETRGLTGRQWRLYILAVDDLRGASSVPASEVSWDALSPSMFDGTLARGVPQILAEGSGDTRMVSKLRFTFRGGDYDAGFYDSQIRFILSSP